MSSWLEFVDNSAGLRAVYGDDLPTLESIELRQVCLHADGPSAYLSFDLAAFPISPPKKWQIARANTVSITIDLLSVRSVSITRWGTYGVSNLTLERKDGSISATLEGREVSMNVVSDFAQVKSMSAYQNSERNV